MAASRTPQKFFAPLAIGAPEPYRALPVKLERMIHFVPPHNEKIRSKIKDITGQVDVVLGNLEDACLQLPRRLPLEAGLRCAAAGQQCGRHDGTGPRENRRAPSGGGQPHGSTLFWSSSRCSPRTPVTVG